MIRFVQQLGLAGAVSLTVAMGLRAADLPGEILQESGWTGGVAVCVGYDEAGPISPLPGFRTQLLESDSQSVARARTRVIAEKVGDKVTVKRWEHGFLPYADNLVNVIIYRYGAGGEEAAAVKEEIRRVLVPGGVAAIRKQGNDGLIAAFSNPLKELENGWVLFTEPTRTDTDDWSHWLHGADGNPVAADQVSGPPRRIQWAATPLRCRSHDVGLSMTGMVTGGGRLFYIADDGPVGMQDHQTHGLETWMLFCRDAYNGVLLWKQPIKDWGMRAWSPAESKADGYGPWSINPRMVHKRLVVEGNRLFVTLGFKAGVSVLDATDGSYLRTLPETEFTSEMVVVANRAYLVVDQAAKEAGRYTTAPRNRIVAVDTVTGKKLWQSEETAGIKDNRTRGFDGALSRLHVTAADGKVFYVDKTEVVALDAQSGQVCWRFKRPPVISLRNDQGHACGQQRMGPVQHALQRRDPLLLAGHPSEYETVVLLHDDSRDFRRRWQDDLDKGLLQFDLSVGTPQRLSSPRADLGGRRFGLATRLEESASGHGSKDRRDSQTLRHVGDLSHDTSSSLLSQQGDRELPHFRSKRGRVR